jgi:SET domain-containing protein
VRVCPDCGLSYQEPKSVSERNAPFVCSACLQQAPSRPPGGWPIEGRWISQSKGRGVFAVQDILKDGLIERCWVMPIPSEESKSTLLIPTINRYLFPWTDGQRAMLSGEGLLYNYDSLEATKRAPNAECILRRGISAVEFRALRNIHTGEEITWNYKRALVRRR